MEILYSFNTIDYLVIALVIFFLFRGYHRALFKSLLEPICFLLCLTFGIINFDLNSNFFHSTQIAILGFFGLSITAYLILWILKKSTVEKEYQNKVFLLSGLSGSIIHAYWRSLILSILLSLIMLSSGHNETISSIQLNIIESRSYHFMNKHILKKITPVKNTLLFLQVLRIPPISQKLHHGKSI